MNSPRTGSCHTPACPTVAEGSADAPAEVVPLDGVRASAGTRERSSSLASNSMPDADQLQAAGLVLAPPRPSGRREEDAAGAARLDAAMRRLEDRLLETITVTLGDRLESLAAEVGSLRAEVRGRH